VSRWHDEFENHPFQPIWNKIIEATTSIVAHDGGDLLAIQEVARLRKVIQYLINLLGACDKELVPLHTWDNFKNQCDECFSHIETYTLLFDNNSIAMANSSLDNLLSLLKPYVVDGAGAARASIAAQREYNRTVSEHISSFVKDSNTAITRIKGNLKRVNQFASDIELVIKKVKQFEDRVFNGKKPLEGKIDDWAIEVENTAAHIKDFHNSLFQNEPNRNSIKFDITELVKEFASVHEDLNIKLSRAESSLVPLREYNAQVFGVPNSIEPHEQGLKAEIEVRRSDLKVLIDEHETKHKALEKEIESLVPGATTAGLAAAYTALKKRASWSMFWFNSLFFISIAGLMALSSVFIVKDFTWSPFQISFLSIVSLEDTLKLVLQRLPFIAPLVWLALFASKRRSESHRLEQEYAHKESTAKSYHSFKQQITAMGEADEHKSLLTQLITTAVETVAHNASTTLDKKHGDKLPSQSAIDGMLNLVEKAKGVLK